MIIHVCEEKRIQRFGKKLKIRDHLEDIGVKRTIILKWIFRNMMGVDWIHTTPDRDQWRTLVTTVMNFRVP
jgi:hypothetical protein